MVPPKNKLISVGDPVISTVVVYASPGISVVTKVGLQLVVIVKPRPVLEPEDSLKDCVPAAIQLSSVSSVTEPGLILRADAL